MRLSRVTAAAAALVPVAVVPGSARAQEPIRVVRHAPVDTARSGDVITISFDRPVAGSLERSANPGRFVRIVPPLPAKVEWRDVVTLRVIPNEPLAPGRRYRITVDTSLLSLDGGRLAAPYQFTIQTRGPKYLGSIPRLDPILGSSLGPRGDMTLVYSASVDDSRLNDVARFEIKQSATCAARLIRYATHVQRALSDSDDYSLLNAGGWQYEGDRRFKRMVILRPQSPLPEGCDGTFVLPSFDGADRDEIRYPMSSAPRFAVSGLSCGNNDCATTSALVLSFTAAVSRESLLDRVHIEPQAPFTIDELDVPSLSWTLRLPSEWRTTYRVTVDSTVHDVFGRALGKPTTVGMRFNDRSPGLGHQLGFFTVSRQHAVLRITHVNVDTAQVAIIAIPESLRLPVLVALGDPDSVGRMVARLRDTVMLTVPLSAAINREEITEVPLPASLLRRFPGSLFAIRAQATGLPLRRQDSTQVIPGRGGQPTRLPTVRVMASGSEEPTNQVALVQVTDLAAHARVSDESGAVFVTDINSGGAVTGAEVVVRDGQARIAATGESDSTGVANLRVSPGWHAPVRQLGDTEWWQYDDWQARARYPAGIRIVEVTRGDDRSVVNVGSHDYYESIAYAPRVVDRSAGGTDQVRALVYTDRPIYRPGERVYIGSIARHGWLGDLKPFPAGDSVRIRVAAFSEDGSEPDVVRDTVMRLSEFGAVADSFSLGGAATLGWYHTRLDLMTQSGWWPRAFGTFRVAEYRAPQFRASLALDSAVGFVGDSIRARANASYYFGAPMASAIVHWNAVATDAAGSLEIPGLPAGFVVAARYASGRDAPYTGWQRSGNDTLDTHGTAEFVVPSVRGTSIGPARLDVSIAVEDVDRQIVTVEQSTVLHSSDYYIAARDSARSWYWMKNQQQTVELLTVRPDGRRVPDAHIVATIVRHHSVVVRRGDSGQASWRWASDTVGHDSITTTDSIVRLRFTPTFDGSYEVVFTSRDDEGRSVSTSIGAYVLSARWQGGWGPTPSALAVRLARDTVASGDTVRFSFISPFDRAEAWVTVEREGVLAQHRRTVQQGEWSLALAVDDRFIPGATVSVLLVDASPAWQTDSVHRRIRTGALSLTVDRSSKAIAVEVEPSARRYAPGDSAKLTIRLRDHRGRPVVGQVSVWAVDESVLALADSERLSPLDSMYARPASLLQFGSTASAMASLGHILRPLGWSRFLGRRSILGTRSLSLPSTIVTGTAGRFENDVPRSEFRTTAFYLAALVTDTNGVVTASAKLPDNLTTYRITAIAVTTGDMFGAAEVPLVVTKPLIARAALPRFVRTGDEFKAGAVITNQTGAAITTTVRASASAMRRVKRGVVDRPLANGASAEARFDWRAMAPPGDTALFQFEVSGGAMSDAVDTPVPVRAPYSPRFHAVAGVARGGEVIRMMLPPNIDPIRSHLTLRVGATPIPAIHAAYAQLRVYPYLCTEQLSSLGRTVVAMTRLQKAGLLDTVSEPGALGLRERLQFVVDELTRRQTADGGIGYWSADGWTSSALTGYAGALLLDARDLGVTVRPRVVAGITEYMQAALERSPVLPDTIIGSAAERSRAVASRLATRLAALHFLRRAGFPDVAREDELVTHERRMVWQDRVWLTELMSGRTDKSLARQMLTHVWRDVEVAGTRVDIPDSLFDTFGFRSHIRPAARLLTATMAIDRDHPRLAQLIETVVRQGKAANGWLWNTQDYASAAEALTQVAMWQRSTAPGGEVIVRSARRGAPARLLSRGAAGAGVSATVPLEGLIERDGDWVALPLRVASDGAPVFYTLTVEEVPLTPPTTPDAKGIIVERWYERFDNGRPVTTVKEGDLVRARLRITVPSDREFVAVADPLPAGLEVVDLSLRTSRTTGPFETVESQAALEAGNRANQSSRRSYYGTWYGGWWSPWEHHEIRDDRVVYFARTLWKGTYTASYVARATTSGTFIRPPAHAEEMYNESLGGRSDGGTFRIVPK